MLDHHIHNRLQILGSHNCSRGIIRERHDQNLALRCNRRFQFFCRQFKLILVLQGNYNRHSVCHKCTRKIGHITRLRYQHFISRIQHSTKHHINRFTASYSHEDFVIRIIFYIYPVFQIICNLDLQFLKPCIRCIKCTSSFQRIDSFFTDSPWRIKIRFSNAQ